MSKAIGLCLYPPEQMSCSFESLIRRKFEILRLAPQALGKRGLSGEMEGFPHKSGKRRSCARRAKQERVKLDLRECNVRQSRQIKRRKFKMEFKHARKKRLPGSPFCDS